MAKKNPGRQPGRPAKAKHDSPAVVAIPFPVETLAVGHDLPIEELLHERPLPPPEPPAECLIKCVVTSVSSRWLSGKPFIGLESTDGTDLSVIREGLEVVVHYKKPE